MNTTNGDRFYLTRYCSDLLDRMLIFFYFLIPVIFLPALVVAIAWLVAFAGKLWNRRWRSIVTVILAPMPEVGRHIRINSSKRPILTFPKISK